jgi:hypothetical protein
MLKELGQVGRWLSAEGFEPAHLSEERLAEFLAARRRAGDRKVPGLRGMRPLLAYLREIGAVAVPVPGSTPLEVLLGQYRTWLVEERGLAEATVQRYEKTARRFLQHAAPGRAGGGGPHTVGTWHRIRPRRRRSWAISLPPIWFSTSS